MSGALIGKPWVERTWLSLKQFYSLRVNEFQVDRIGSDRTERGDNELVIDRLIVRPSYGLINPESVDQFLSTGLSLWPSLGGSCNLVLDEVLQLDSISGHSCSIQNVNRFWWLMQILIFAYWLAYWLRQQIFHSIEFGSCFVRAELTFSIWGPSGFTSFLN